MDGGLEDMDRSERLDVLWRLWQRNYGDETSMKCEDILKLLQDADKTSTAGGLHYHLQQQIEQQQQPSIKHKSLQLIMEQLFAEICFLKDEVRFLREEGTHKSELITTLTDNTLGALNTKTNQEDGFGYPSCAHSASRLTYGRRTNKKSSQSTSNPDPPTDRKNDQFHESDDDVLSVVQDGAFLKEEIRYLREETKEKSKLIETLTEALTRNNLKEEISLDQLVKQCNHLIKRREKTKELATDREEDRCEGSESGAQEASDNSFALEIIEECGLNYLMDYELGEIS